MENESFEDKSYRTLLKILNLEESEVTGSFVIGQKLNELKQEDKIAQACQEILDIIEEFYDRNLTLYQSPIDAFIVYFKQRQPEVEIFPWIDALSLALKEVGLEDSYTTFEKFQEGIGRGLSEVTIENETYYAISDNVYKTYTLMLSIFQQKSTEYFENKEKQRQKEYASVDSRTIYYATASEMQIEAIRKQQKITEDLKATIDISEVFPILTPPSSRPLKLNDTTIYVPENERITLGVYRTMDDDGNLSEPTGTPLKSRKKIFIPKDLEDVMPIIANTRAEVIDRQEAINSNKDFTGFKPSTPIFVTTM